MADQYTNADLQKTTEHLCTIVSQIDHPIDAFAFLRDLMTPSEMVEFAQRLDIACRLEGGEQYKTIEEQTGASSATIARVKKFLDGERGGYKKQIGGGV